MSVPAPGGACLVASWILLVAGCAERGASVQPEEGLNFAGRGESASDPPAEPAAVWVLTPLQEFALGDKAFASFSEDHPPSADRELIARVERIGGGLVEHAEGPTFPYRFFVYRDETLQATTLPGGWIGVSEGLVRLFEDDDELAFAVAHELAHAALRHAVARERLQRILDPEAVRRLQLGLDPAGGEPLPPETLAALGSWGRDQELEADKYGALYLLRSGRRFSAARSALARLESAGGAPPSAATHPEPGIRIDALDRYREVLDKLMKHFDRGVKALGEPPDPDAAIEAFRTFLVELPGDTAARINLGAAYLARARLHSGTPEDLAETLPILSEPTSKLRGGDLRDARLALSEFEVALARNDREPLALAGAALAGYRLPDGLARARERLDSARALAPRDPSLALCRGNAAFLAGEYALARAAFAEALALVPDDPAHGRPVRSHALWNLALTAERLDDADAAHAIWCQLEADPRYGDQARRRVKQAGVRCPDRAR